MADQETVLGRFTTLNIEETARDPLSLHWSAIFAGVFVSLLVYFMLMSLGLAFGGSAVRDVFQTDDTLPGVAIGAGVWTVASILIALFCGSYASGRASSIIATRIGYTQGAVITALFFAVMITQVGSAVGVLSRSVGQISSSVIGSSVTQIARNPRLLAVVEDSLGAANLKSPPASVIAGLTQRLMRGDTNSAKAYLAAQAGISQAEAQQKIDTLNLNFQAALREIGSKASVAASRLGWAAFVTILLGTVSAMLGGGTGAMVNLRKPLDRVDERALRRIPAYT